MDVVLERVYRVLTLLGISTTDDRLAGWPSLIDCHPRMASTVNPSHFNFFLDAWRRDLALGNRIVTEDQVHERSLPLVAIISDTLREGF